MLPDVSTFKLSVVCNAALEESQVLHHFQLSDISKPDLTQILSFKHYFEAILADKLII